MNDKEKLATARKLFGDWERRDWDAILDSFAPDGALHSMMTDPVSGRPALEKLFGGFKDAIEALSIEIEYLGIIDDAVISVRKDRMTVGGRQGELPAVGVIHFDDNGKIRLWREYFDRATMLREMGADKDWIERDA